MKHIKMVVVIFLDSFFQIFIEFATLVFFFFGHKACGVLAVDQGSSPVLEGEVLTLDHLGGPDNSDNFKTFLLRYLLLLFSYPVVSNSLQPQARPPCPSSSPRVCPSSCPLNQWCHPASSSVTLFSFCLQSYLHRLTVLFFLKVPQ